MGYRDFLEAGYRYLTEAVEERIGYTVVQRQELEVLEAVQQDYRAQSRELELLGWHALDYVSGNPHEVKPKKRIDAAKQARMAWMWDPMAGAATELMNDFVFGRGVPQPRARNPEVQKVIDQAWKDADNVAVLTGYQAQLAAGTDLSLQSNLFILFFADGEDGHVKMSLLDHDTVVDVVRDPENRMRPLYYVATFSESEWDFDNDQLKPKDVTNQVKRQVRYYAHWKNVEDAEKDIALGIRKKDSLPTPPKDKMGDGLVYHIAINRTSEMVFGVPAMQRTLRWFSAYNDLMSARVDMAKAAAELIMKRKVKGSPTQLARLAQGAIGRGGEIATLPSPTRIGGLPAGTLVENENVTHEKFNLDSGSQGAAADATMIRSQVSAGTRFPQHYLGDQGNANLATATAMDLPVTKMVESRQELWEQLYRAFTDLAIRRAVETGKLQGELPGEEDAEVTDYSKIGEAASDTAATGGNDTSVANGNGRGRIAAVAQRAKDAAMASDGNSNNGKKPDGTNDSEGKTKDGKTDLSYEFKMPNPLRRLMTDLVNSLQTVAKTFDPNGTNVELSRTLLTIALGEALEMQDPSDAVDRIFPPGYQDPLVAMELAAGAAGQQQGADAAAASAEGVTPGGGQQRGGLTLDNLTSGTPAAGGEPGSGKRGPYGTKSGATPPEKVKEALLHWQTADPEELLDALTALVEGRFAGLPEDVQAAAEHQIDGMADEFALMVGSVADAVVETLPALAGTNGHV